MRPPSRAPVYELYIVFSREQLCFLKLEDRFPPSRYNHTLTRNITRRVPRNLAGTPPVAKHLSWLTAKTTQKVVENRASEETSAEVSEKASEQGLTLEGLIAEKR